MKGASGLTKATQVAILSANYIAKKLNSAFPTLYTGKNGFIAHECIIDIREITKKTGVTVDDIAKRLMDFGFHAPTMSFPVAGTLMIEPTESEDVGEIDRFISAMLRISEEISAIESGQVQVEDSPLRNAPHTAETVVSDHWEKGYSREQAAFPDGVQIGMARRGKYWPTVGRIDGAYGDRNLVCACEPIEALAIN
jgi:glycine dehydrogenase